MKGFNTEKHEEKTANKNIDNCTNKIYKNWYTFNMYRCYKALFVWLFVSSTLFATGYLTITGTITLGDFFFYKIIVGKICMFLWQIMRIIQRLIRQYALSQEMVDILNDERVDLETGNKDLKIDKPSIEFKNVSFGNGNKKIFNNLNLKINPGEKVAIVGETGAGKSTFVKLLFRYFEPNEGEILISDKNIRKHKKTSLRKHLSLVPQTPGLLHRSIKDNITYAKPNTTPSELESVVQKAQLEKFIKKLSKSYDTLVGERGIKLSGGEQQRVAIARAMLKDSPFLVLDEATSSLDNVTEKQIQKAIDNLIENKTVIIVAHRLSTIKKCDRILVFDHGKIVEEGSHNKLLKQNGKYKELWDHQFEKEHKVLA